VAEQLPLDFTVSATQRHRRAVKHNDEVAQLDLFASWTWSPNIDIHLDGPDEAVANIAGKDPDRAHDWLSGMVGGNITVHKPRKVAFPTSYLDRFLHLRPPAQVTLDAASTAVARALWARKLGLKPIRVVKDGRRLTGTTHRRWPTGFSMKDIPWSSIHAAVHLDLDLEVDENAKNLFAKKLTIAGTKIATSGIAGSAVTITTSRPDLVERLNLPGLAYDGIRNSGQYRLPILTAEPLLRQDIIEVPAQVGEAIRKATRPIRPLTGLPDTFPWQLYDFQAADAGRALRILETTGGVLLAGDMGSGKAVASRNYLLTPEGKKRASDVRAGDRLVGRDGLPTEVLGVYPQGERPSYRVTFSDRTVIDVDDDHLWSVQSPVMKKRGRGYKTLTTKELREGGIKDAAGNRRWYIPMCEPIQFAGNLELPVDPYVLGALLGDGCLRGGAVSFGSVDEFMIDELRRLTGLDVIVQGKTARRRAALAAARGVPVEEIRDVSWRLRGAMKLRENLKDLGVYGKRAWEKSVPRDYLFGTVEQRTALLQGLLDTDGGLPAAGKRPSSIEFTSTSEQLADDIVWLAQSLGGVGRKSGPVRKSFTYNEEKKLGRPCWRVSFAFPDHVKPFRLPRKADAYQPREKYQPTRGIESIERVGTDDMVCFQVAAEDSLFLDEQALCLHNTTVSLAIVEHLNLFPMLVVSPLSAFSTWARQLKEMGRTYYMATESPAKSWAAMEENEYDAIVMSFDRISAFVELIERKSFKSVVADEVQRIRTPGSKRSRAIRQIAGSIPYRMGLSGTPLTNTVNDVLPLGAFLVPGEWKPRANDKDLEDLYPGEPTESLAEHLGSIMVRRRIDQVGRPMAKRNDHRVYIQLTPEQRRALTDLEAEAEAAKAEGAFDDNSGRMHAFAQLQKMRQIINSPAAAGVKGPNPKVSAALDLAKDFLAQGRKGVIFCADRTTFREIGKSLDEEGIGWVGIWGSTPPADRIENERKFHANEPAPNGHPTDVVVCTIQAGAESWSASPTGTWLISTAYVYAPSTLAQMEARVHRLSSLVDGPEIQIVYIHALGPSEKTSLDDRMVQILEVKKHLFAQVVDRQVHEDKTNVSYTMGDLVYLMTGVRDEKLDAREKDAKKTVDKEKARTEHAKKSLYKHKRNNADLLDDTGDVAMTLEEHRAQSGMVEFDEELDAMLEAADHLEDFDGALE
jgi:superfamily II DNA or RNA helicase